MINMSEESGEINVQKVGQEQVHSLLFSDRLSWQAIIYDLINTEQLDPWDIDIVLLSQRFLERIKNLEEANFFISSKVLLAAALLLRIKSEILLNEDIQSLDDILFGKKEQKKYVQERLELDEDVPGLVPRTPLPRFRKVSLQELISALGKAITTENRRIKRVVLQRQQELETSLSLPKKAVNIKDQISSVERMLEKIFSNRSTKIGFSEISGDNNESRIMTFIPLLHLDNQHKVWLEQSSHFDEIWIMLKEIYENQNAEFLTYLKKEVEEAMKLEVEEEGGDAVIDDEGPEGRDKFESFSKRKDKNDDD
jgi:segregation and condensation protein A